MPLIVDNYNDMSSIFTSRYILYLKTSFNALHIIYPFKHAIHASYHTTFLHSNTTTISPQHILPPSYPRLHYHSPQILLLGMKCGFTKWSKLRQVEVFAGWSGRQGAARGSLLSQWLVSLLLKGCHCMGKMNA